MCWPVVPYYTLPKNTVLRKISKGQLNYAYRFDNKTQYVGKDFVTPPINCRILGVSSHTYEMSHSEGASIRPAA